MVDMMMSVHRVSHLFLVEGISETGIPMCHVISDCKASALYTILRKPKSFPMNSIGDEEKCTPIKSPQLLIKRL